LKRKSVESLPRRKETEDFSKCRHQKKHKLSKGKKAWTKKDSHQQGKGSHQKKGEKSIARPRRKRSRKDYHPRRKEKLTSSQKNSGILKGEREGEVSWKKLDSFRERDPRWVIRKESNFAGPSERGKELIRRRGGGGSYHINQGKGGKIVKRHHGQKKKRSATPRKGSFLEKKGLKNRGKKKKIEALAVIVLHGGVRGFYHTCGKGGRL